jgi:hypothetical protein
VHRGEGERGGKALDFSIERRAVLLNDRHEGAGELRYLFWDLPCRDPPLKDLATSAKAELSLIERCKRIAAGDAAQARLRAARRSGRPAPCHC